jgi:hypothetical protein
MTIPRDARRLSVCRQGRVRCYQGSGRAEEDPMATVAKLDSNRYPGFVAALTATMWLGGLAAGAARAGKVLWEVDTHG